MFKVWDPLRTDPGPPQGQMGEPSVRVQCQRWVPDDPELYSIYLSFPISLCPATTQALSKKEQETALVGSTYHLVYY